MDCSRLRLTDEERRLLLQTQTECTLAWLN
ncbi:Uncharacterised protein [Mycobacterium xenopi]|uniref:Uncharacterized protein n=1 Tax=Mycobacterium xenopi TaxID=1789 RepID=A0AAD1H048_MYCXE|nr:hypothetical protein MYXE_08180 [Mycobacterium xenopi]SPX79068.1 Uncharacterised protein [Mycobacterium xenopi]